MGLNNQGRNFGNPIASALVSSMAAKMAKKVKPIKGYTAQELYMTCHDVTPETVMYGKMIMDMIDVMRVSDHAIALAANQIGYLHRIVVMRMDGKLEVFLNPIFTPATDETIEFEEGCLSFPGIGVKKTRSKAGTIHFMNDAFEPQQIDVEGLYAVAIQHEIDHLNGITMLSHLPQEKQKYWMNKSKQAYAKNIQRGMRNRPGI